MSIECTETLEKQNIQFLKISALLLLTRTDEFGEQIEDSGRYSECMSVKLDTSDSDVSSQISVSEE